MLVNASQFPGPALWQGLMLIVVAAWAVFVFVPRREPISGRVFFGSIGLVIAFGIGLIMWIVMT